jgi:hypothetical protein
VQGARQQRQQGGQFGRREPLARVAPRVLAEIISRSCCAKAAITCKSSGVANGISTATNGTFASIRPAMKLTLRPNRSSFAITSVAFFALQAARACASTGRSFRLPDSTSTNSPSISP